MFVVGDTVQIYNHAEPSYNHQFGVITGLEIVYNDEVYYDVLLDDLYTRCVCSADELMEG